MNTSAGCACLKINIAAQVKAIANKQRPKLIQQSGNLKSSIVLGRVAPSMQLSTSYLRQSDRNSPGMIISPSPSILNLTILFQSTQGKSNLSGKSIFLATVTITSDWQTQYKSQKNSSQRVGRAILKERRPAYFKALIANQRAKKLLSHQYLVTVKRIQNKATKAGHSRYLDAFYIHFKYFSSQSTLFVLSLNCQMTILCSRVPPQTVVPITKTRSNRVLIVISLIFLIRQYRERSTTHPKAGYFTIYQQFCIYLSLELLVLSYYSHCLICLQEALPKLIERIEPI